jgi:DNA-binding transcriptional LysR family regulator
MITLTQLRTFLEVAEGESVHQAAARLFVTPPAVSAALASLQREVGSALVSREGRGVRLTEAGRVFVPYARRVLGLLDEAAAAAAGQERPEAGRVRVAAVTTAGEHLLPRYLASFRARYPEAEVRLEVGNRARVWDVLDNHEVDVAIGGQPGAEGRFVTLATRPNTLVVVAAPTGGKERALPLSRNVTVADLAERVWLLREPGSGTRATTEELFEELGISPRTLTLGSNGAVRASAQVNLGITLISRDAVARELSEGNLEEWRREGLVRRRAWHLVGRAGEDLPATAALFVGHLVGSATPRMEAFRLA